MASCASSSARRHRAGQGVRAPADRRPASSPHTRVGSATTRRAAVPSGSTHAAEAVTWTCSAPDAASHWASTFEAGGRPSRRTTVGVCAAAKPAWRSRSSNAATVDGRGSRQPDRGSASTGQPAAVASACTASGSPAPAPATITPRCWSRPAASASSWSWSSAGRPLTAWYHGRPAGRPGGRSPAWPTSGSRKGRLRWTGPGQGPTASASARETSDRQRDAIAASGGPGSAA